jgi:hypothetical protein
MTTLILRETGYNIIIKDVNNVDIKLFSTHNDRWLHSAKASVGQWLKSNYENSPKPVKILIPAGLSHWVPTIAHVQRFLNRDQCCALQTSKNIVATQVFEQTRRPSVEHLKPRMLLPGLFTCARKQTNNGKVVLTIKRKQSITLPSLVGIKMQTSKRTQTRGHHMVLRPMRDAATANCCIGCEK